MKQSVIYILIALLLSSCTNWLDVGSKSELDEDEMYQSLSLIHI